MQGSHRHEKYLKMKGCLKKSLKMNFVLKSTCVVENRWVSLKSTWISMFSANGVTSEYNIARGEHSYCSINDVSFVKMAVVVFQ